MNDVLLQIKDTISLIPVLMEVFWIALGLSLPSIYQYLHRKYKVQPKYASIFTTKRGKAINCIIPTLGNDIFEADEYIEYTTPLESVVNIQYIISIMDRLNIPHNLLKVIFSRGASTDDVEQNLILIGGPNHNGWTREVMKSVDAPFVFDGHTLVSNVSHNRYDADISKQKIVKEFVIFAVIQNPWNELTRVILAAGCRGYGSIGVFKFADSGELISTLRSHSGFKPKSDFFAVLSFDVNIVGNNVYKFSNLNCEEIVLL